MSDSDPAPRRKPTSTSSFGVGRRESHDSTAFYDRFTAPHISNDEVIAVNPPDALDRIHVGDARHMPEVLDSSVALVVTSPPYFAGKDYETALGEGHIPASYRDYLAMLTEVFAECVRKLEPGGRIAVNVANLGRRPYRSLAADVITILQDDLKLLLRGEIVWVKGQGASGSTAWGSFQSAANPVLRDLTERVVVASKGRFDRALSRLQRAKQGLPSEVSIFKDDFMDATTDVWELPPESATRVNHPAPFPVELPLRLIELYTYRGDVVLDPFIGSGSTAVAATRSERSFVGYDTEERYVAVARERVRAELARRAAPGDQRARVVLPARPGPAEPGEDSQSRAVREGRRAKEIARAVLEDCGFTDIVDDYRLRNGVEINFVASDAKGHRWFFDVSGAFTSARPGLRRTDTLWKALGKAAVIASSNVAASPLVFLTTNLPPPGSSGDLALRASRGGVFHDAIEMLSPQGQERLRHYASGKNRTRPLGDLLAPL
ncbi:MAG TPA: site-specific DNA-methyltransferase [Actinomycetota bacterium]|nr:site-specific DNA-methyltransferase [Actinomycetota bacterium]